SLTEDPCRGRQRNPPHLLRHGGKSTTTVARRSAPSHAVGEIPDRSREIGRFVPPHDDAKVLIDEEGRPIGAVRHDQRGLVLAGGERARVAAANAQPAPFARRASYFQPRETRVEAMGNLDLPTPALAAAP